MMLSIYIPLLYGYYGLVREFIVCYAQGIFIKNKEMCEESHIVLEWYKIMEIHFTSKQMHTSLVMLYYS